MSQTINKTIRSLFESQEDCRIYLKGEMWFYGKITDFDRKSIELTVFDKDFSAEDSNAMGISRVALRRSAIIAIGYGWQYLKKAQMKIADPSVEESNS